MKKFEEMGCYVIYGLIGFKIYCKFVFVVWWENEGIKCYMYMGIGNYNDVIVYFYMDMGFFIVDIDMGIDVFNIFNMLFGYFELLYFYKLYILLDGICDFINEKLDDEIVIVKVG